MGGENVTRVVRVIRPTGSSPRGRGKHPRRPRCRPRDRLIPAWAGKTKPSTMPRARSGAHPRVGGENARVARGARSVRGSSPRGRGKLGMLSARPPVMRLIPAWAGKTSTRERPASWRQAHPRVGGENRLNAPLMWSRAGSSPRGRGKLRPESDPQGVTRLIPAWAGKTRLPIRRGHASRAHPRVGGENEERVRATVDSEGSSPRGRGKRRLL